MGAANNGRRCECRAEGPAVHLKANCRAFGPKEKNSGVLPTQGCALRWMNSWAFGPKTHFLASIRSFPIQARRTSGTTIEPSACW